RDEITDILAHRRLALKAATGKTPIVGQRCPKRPLHLRWITAKKPRQAANRAALFGNTAATMLGQERAQKRGLFAVEYAAARRPFAALGNGHDHAMQRLDILLCRFHAGENVAQIDLHGLALVRRAKELDLLEFAFDGFEESKELLLGRQGGLVRHRERQYAAARKLEPFI